jgi:hypothetical protein
MTPELPEPLRVALLAIAALEDLGIQYQIGGSFASSIHGVPRQTQDIDLVVALPAHQVEPLVRRLTSEFYVDREVVHEAVRDRRSFNVIHLATGFKVDVFIHGSAAFDRMDFSRRQAVRVQSEPPREIVVESAEDTVLRKLLWYRAGGEVSERQWADVIGILRTSADRLDRDYMVQWAAVLGVSEMLARAFEA